MKCGMSINMNIAGIHLVISLDHSVRITDNFLPFIGTGIVSDYKAEYVKVDDLPSTEGEMLVNESDYSVWKNAGGLVRCFYDRKNQGRVYALTSLDEEKKYLLVQYLPEGEEFFTDTGNCFFHLMWEKLLIQEQRMIFHAACIDTEWGGILFAGPSGIGKSTQADLWCKYTRAQLLNGDRTILYNDRSKWYAYGSPYAGSSRCYVNECCCVRAIVILSKGRCCRLRHMRAAEAFQKIYSGLTVNSWDIDFVEKVCDMINDLIKNVAVYELCCTPDKEAVEILQEELKKGETEWSQRK